MRAEVTAARALGISYKRLQGWEPTTVYEYDEAGRLVSSRPETEWDDTERAWMLSLAEWEATEVCPMCGMPKDVCQSRDAEFNLEVALPTRCHVKTAIRRAQEARQSGPSTKYDDALIWGVRMKDQLLSP